jgi:hypothetical protein
LAGKEKEKEDLRRKKIGNTLSQKCENIRLSYGKMK